MKRKADICFYVTLLTSAEITWNNRCCVNTWSDGYDRQLNWLRWETGYQPIVSSGSSLLKSFAWPLKAKKRHRSGSGGSKEFEQKTKKSLSAQQQRRLTGTFLNFFFSSTLGLINCALVAEGPILRVNYLQEPIPRHPMACPTIHHYLHSRHLLIIHSSNFFPEFLLQSHQLCA